MRACYEQLAASGKVNQALRPNCDSSHSIRLSPPLDPGIASYLAVLFGPQKADQDHPNKKVQQEGDIIKVIFDSLHPEQAIAANGRSVAE